MPASQHSLESQQERLADEAFAGDEDGSSSEVERPEPKPETWGKNHPVNIRLTIPLIFTNCYVTIVAGKERRAPDRRAVEREKHPVTTIGNLVFLGTVGIICAFGALTVFQLATAQVLMRFGLMDLP